jgi:pyrroline-5-carboxylate reductase
LENKKIAVIGAGNMGTALIRGLVKAKWCSPERVMATHPRDEKTDALAKEFKIKTANDNAKAAEWADVVVLAVKPQILPAVMKEIAGEVGKEKLIVSIAAGVTTATIEDAFGKVPVIRTMPNIATTVELGATALCVGRYANEVHREMARSIFEAVGMVVKVPEDLMDAVTGLSGTGPMYIFQIIEGLSDAGVKVGMSRHIASALAIQTVLGAAKMAQTLKKHPAELKDLVTSPGGTAITALHSLERNRLRAILMDAVEAATNRSRELGQLNEKKTTTTS